MRSSLAAALAAFFLALAACQTRGDYTVLCGVLTCDDGSEPRSICYSAADDADADALLEYQGAWKGPDGRTCAVDFTIRVDDARSIYCGATTAGLSAAPE